MVNSVTGDGTLRVRGVVVFSYKLLKLLNRLAQLIDLLLRRKSLMDPLVVELVEFLGISPGM